MQIGPNFHAFRLTRFLLAALLALPFAVGSAAQSEGQAAWFVQLESPPTVKVYVEALAEAKAADRDDAESLAVARGVDALKQIKAAQDRVADKLRAVDPNLTELYRLQRTLNGIAIFPSEGNMPALEKIDGVKAVLRIAAAVPHNSSSVPFIGAQSVWESYGYTGSGIKIGVIDTGIDYRHADFGGDGNPNPNDPTILDGGFPSAKIPGGIDLVGDVYDNVNVTTPSPDLDPVDLWDHGTHVAGAIGGFGVTSTGDTYTGTYDASTNLADMRIGPGAAPESLLYSIKVFGPAGSTNFAPAGIEWAIDPDGNGDFADRMDVICLALGSSGSDPEFEPTAMAANAAVDAGAIVVAAAGDVGDEQYIVSTPAAARKVIAVANSQDPGVTKPQLLVDAPPAIAGLYEVGGSNFTPALTSPGITERVVYVEPHDSCSSPTNPADLTGHIALIDRGGCRFDEKVAMAQSAGAIAAIIVNNSGDSLVDMNGEPGIITIPAFFLGQSDGQLIKDELANDPLSVIATFSSDYDIPQTDLVYSGSSRGPARQGIMKPDVAAPGVNITSAAMGTVDQPLVRIGTSQAAGLAAGAMALLKEAHPDWTPQELKALLMNTAYPFMPVELGNSTPRYDPARIGAGRIDIAKALSTSVIAYATDNPDGVHLYQRNLEVPPGTKSWTQSVTVKNLGASAASFIASPDLADDLPGVFVSLPSGVVVDVPAGGTKTIDIRIEGLQSQMYYPLPGAMSPLAGGNPRYWFPAESGNLVMKDASSDIQLPFYYPIRPVGAVRTSLTNFPLDDQHTTFTLPLTGTPMFNDSSMTPNADAISVMSPYELTFQSPRNTIDPRKTSCDLKYVGIQRLNGQDGPSTALIAFGIVTWGDWGSPAYSQTRIFIDSDLDGTDDYMIRCSLFSAALLVNEVIRLSDGGSTWLNYLSGQPTTALHLWPYNTNVLLLECNGASIGLSDTHPKFNYRVEIEGYLTGHSDSTPTLHYDAKNPGLTFPDRFVFPNMTSSIDVTYDRAAFKANASEGLLMIHHQNGEGARALILQPAPPGPGIGWMYY
ncbi:S8 family serine peptidase [bacterium]|nr:S8 family serine peptidase [bacterium]